MRSTRYVEDRDLWRDLRKRDHFEDEQVLKRIFKKWNVGALTQGSDRWWTYRFSQNVGKFLISYSRRTLLRGINLPRRYNVDGRINTGLPSRQYPTLQEETRTGHLSRNSPVTGLDFMTAAQVVSLYNRYSFSVWGWVKPKGSRKIPITPSEIEITTCRFAV